MVNELSVNLDHYFDMVRNSFEYIANNSTVQEELESDEPYKSNGTELYSYYSRSGQIRRLLLQGYTSIYMKDIQLYGYNGANHLLANNREIMKRPLRYPVNWRSRQKDAVFIIMLLRKA